MLKKNLFLLLLFLWFVFITTLSLVSMNNFSKVSIKGADNYVHFCFYFVLTVLLVINFITHFKLKKTFILSVAFAIFYGMIIEVLQGVLTSNREPEIKDVLFNSLGSLTAAFLLFLNRERLNFLK
ncbi:MAG: VanZ family protein [Flavobacterium sp.]|nr:VanZ family protein [Flavobacterium sp.]